MEFYKEYNDENVFLAETRKTNFTLACKLLNDDVTRNPQWKSEVVGYTIYNDCTYILVRWVGLSETPFNENEK